MWTIMRDAGFFSTPLARTTVVAAILSHYFLGGLLLVAIAKADPAESARA
jgi:hypothetical protein